jgi:carboxyl-terminal processing protease
MSMKIKVAILACSATLLLFVVVGGMNGVRASSNEGAYRQMQVYSEVLSRVQQEYVEDPNIPAVTDGALHGLLESLDANSSYLSPSQYKEYKLHKADVKGDIGAAMSKRFGYASVIAIVPGGPADKAGVQATDIFEAIEGKSTREMSLAEVHNLLSGASGSNVTVSIVRARKAEPQKLVITREIVNIPPASDKELADSIGQIHVDSFAKGESQEIAAKVKSLQKAGVKKLILDLRNCAAGDETEGIATANLFLNHGTITYLQGQKYPREAFNADPAKTVTALPLVVLVNKGTSGPAEVVAGALLDNARADVIGDKTFGDGTVEKVIEMKDGSALILSVAKYYAPSGKAIQDAAVTPNVVVADVDDSAALPDDDENATPADEATKKPAVPQPDVQLEKAIEVLKNRTS